MGVRLIPTLSFRLFRAAISVHPSPENRRQETDDATVHIMEGGCSTDFSLCAFLHGHPNQNHTGLPVRQAG